MPYPFTTSLTTGRSYYGSALQQQPQTSLYTTEPQQPFYNSSALPAGIGLAALFGSGFIPIGQNRLWDFYTKGIRAVEEYSPATILRTFQLSTFFSQFQSPINRGFTISAEDIVQNRAYRDYLTKLIGPLGSKGLAGTAAKLQAEGAVLRGGQLFFGKGGLALKYASRITAPAAAGMQYGLGYAGSLGINLSKRQIPVEDDIMRQIIGGRNIFQHIGRQATGWGTTLVGRFNQLLELPFEIEPFRTAFSKVRPYLGKYGLGVKPGTGLQMMGRLAGKYGLGLGALYMGYQTVDYAMRNADLLEGTLFEEGLTTGIASLGVRGNLLLSQAAESTGLHKYREAQEEVAPGSTSLQKLLALPLVGGWMGVIAGYGAKVARMANLQWTEGLTAEAARKVVEEEHKVFGGRGFFAEFGKSFTQETGSLYNRQDFIGRTLRAMGKPTSSGAINFKFLGKIGPIKLMGLLGMGLGVAATLPFLPGALIPSTRPDELERIYSGEQEVAIRKGRWWEFGRSEYEGGRIMYYRPHWYPMMRMRAKEKAIYGDEELNPFEKFWKREFTYELEKQHYADRPYPITSLPFEDVPLVGPLLAATIGRMIKPERLMHTEDWLTDRGVVVEPPNFGGRVATEIGEKPPGLPVSPYTPTQIIGEQAYRMTEMIGLPGFVATSIKQELTGTPELFDQVRQLESARRIAGYEREYWDKELGGMLGMNEAFRRLFPHRRRQIPLYNPIPNRMPDWLPGEGDRSPNFRVGDPFTKVQMGEIRLPGRGYEERFPELRGVAPENYPLAHQYRILADVAPYSEKFDEITRQIRVARKRKDWSDYEENMYQTAREQLRSRRARKEFNEYKYLSPTGIFGGRDAADSSTGLMATINEMKAAGQKEPGVWTKLFGGYWEALSHNTETVLDQLTPIAPGAKLMHQRTAIEDYERTQLFGTSNAFWNRPYENFIRPFLQSTAASFGFTGIPEHLKEKRKIEEYFDILQYTKFARLSRIARMSRDNEAQREFESKKDETLFGINPFTRNYTSLYRALPRSERDYFAAFEKAGTQEERAKILDMVPDNEKALYVARWKLALADDIRKAKKAGVLSEAQVEEADNTLDNIYDEARREGFPASKELLSEYIQTRLEGENYGDWYRRTKVLSKMALPGPDWVGWCIPSDQVVINSFNQHISAKNVCINDILNTQKETGIVKSIYKREVDEKINQISVAGNKVDKLSVTQNHPILAIKAKKCSYNLKHNSICSPQSQNWKCNFCTNKEYKKYKVQWIQAKDIDKDTFLVYPFLKHTKENLIIDISKEINWEDLNFIVNEETIFPKTGIRKPIKRFIVINEAIAWLIGYYLAEGNVWKTGKRLRGIQFTAHIQEKPILELASKIIKKYFGLSSRIVERKRSTGNSVCLIVASSMFALLINKWVGRFCDKKFAPYWLEQITHKAQIALLDGLNTGDASKDKRQRLILTNYSLCFMAKRIWESLGIPVSIRKICKRNRKDQYAIEPVVFPLNHILLDGYIAYRVFENKLIDYTGEVYDFEIEEDHSYLSPIAILHNSPSVDLKDIKLKLVQTLSEDMHDYDLWASDAQALVNKPYINDDIIKEIVSPPDLSDNEMRANINELFLSNGARPNTFIEKSWGRKQKELNVELEQDVDIQSLLKGII